jgi:peptidoglycan/LPS O-acetylase OafA/YrhL
MYFRKLQVLRGLAALAVAPYHVHEYLSPISAAGKIINLSEAGSSDFSGNSPFLLSDR